MRAAIALIACALAACGGDDAEGDPTRDGSTYLAFSADFAGYATWRAFAEPATEGGGSLHTSGARVEYINRMPPPGAAVFAPGTIIVKDIAAAGVEPRHVFAMVKRGGTYNAKGTVGWEWFELAPTAGAAVTIEWRGVGPPRGTTYGGDANGACNTCHLAARDNDFVQSSKLRLPP